MASFKEAILYIKKDSVGRAEKVSVDIIGIVRKLAENPGMYPPDKFRLDKDARYRAFEKHNIRVSYFVVDDMVRVLRVRHTKQQPLEY